MSASHTDGLMSALRTAFGEPAVWQQQGDGLLPVPFYGRFRIDPFDVSLGQGEGLNTTQTWIYCARMDFPEAVPAIGAILLVRGVYWEIVQIDADDIGELGFRLIKDYSFAAAAPLPHASAR